MIKPRAIIAELLCRVPRGVDGGVMQGLLAATSGGTGEAGDVAAAELVEAKPRANETMTTMCKMWQKG